MISHFFALVTKARPKRRRARPKLPNRAERMYLGALRRYADGFREAVLAEVREQYPELVGERKDALTGGPFRGMREIRLRLTKLREMLPLDIVGAEVADHAQREAERVIGLKNSELFLRGQVVGWRRDNVDLITRFTEEQLDRVEALLEDYDGLRVEDTASELESVFGVTRARAELIARTETLKLNANMNQQAQFAAGVAEYTWSTSQDSSVRDDHADLDGHVFSWDNPPITNQHEVDKGKPERRNHPGCDFQCRCIAIPKLEEYDRDEVQDM